MINFDYSRPQIPALALQQLQSNPRAMCIAGGTNLVDLMKRGVTAPEKVIDLTALPFDEIKRTDTGLMIGSMVTNTAAAENDIIRKEFPLIRIALEAGASPQIRNVATIGGNLLQRTRCTYFYDIAMPCNKRNAGSGCGALKGYNRMHAVLGASPECIAVHPSDLCVALAAYNSIVVLENTSGIRRIPFREFHRLPGDKPGLDNNMQRAELIMGIEIRSSKAGNNVHYLKIRDRNSFAFALVSVAAALEMDGNKIRKAGVALGGVAHKPWFSMEAERFLEGKEASLEIFKEAAKIIIKSARGYGYNDFKIPMAIAAVQEALVKASNPAS